MREFWVASGHHLARLTPEGWMAVTDELILAWLARPEILPPEEACEVERALHVDVTRAPRAAVAPARIAGIADPDARENWTHLIGFRDRLIACGTIEGAWLDIVRRGVAVPPVFLNNVVQLILRNALDGCEDPFVLRGAEMLFRPQRGSIRDGALVLEDAEAVEAMEEMRRVSPLMAMMQAGELDVMSEANAWTYWSRSDAHAMACNFGADARARDGLAAAIAAFVGHLFRGRVRVDALTDVREPDLRWFVGLDADATAIGNALWRGETPSVQARLVGLFRLEFADSGDLLPGAAGHPVYLLMALPEDNLLRLKPQNLVAGLPLAATAMPS
jgi:hypothetical protein